MVREETSGLLIEDDGSTAAMRAEAASRALATNNWMLAALITTNGGGILTLLNQPVRGWAVVTALIFYLLGVTASLLAGRLAANLAHETESMFVSLLAQTRASRALSRTARSGSPAAWERANRFVEDMDKKATEAVSDFERAPTPDAALGFGVIFFFVASIFAGLGVL